MTEVYKHTRSRCPGCRQTLNATGDPHGRGAPRPGDLSVCSGCGTILRFDHRLHLIAMTPRELERLPSGTAAELQDMQTLWQDRNRKRFQVPQ